MEKKFLGEYFKAVLDHTNKKYPLLVNNVADMQDCCLLSDFFNLDVDRSRVTTQSMDNGVNIFADAVGIFTETGEKDSVESEGIFYRKVQGKHSDAIPDFPFSKEMQGAFLKFSELFSSASGMYASLNRLLKALPVGHLSVRQVKRPYVLKNGKTQVKIYDEMRCYVPKKGRLTISTKDSKDMSIIFSYRDICQGISDVLEGLLKKGDKLFKEIFEEDPGYTDMVKRTEERIKFAERESRERNESIRQSNMCGRGDNSDENENFVVDDIKKRGKATAKPPQWYGRRCRGVTEGGNYISSKNEAIFANMIEQYNIPYACEVSLRANKANQEPYTVDFFYYPVFGKNPIYVEIFGSVGDDGYRDRAYNKISNYHKAGVKMGENLIVFVCGHKSLINTALMHKVLLMSLAGYVPVGPVIV